MTYRSNGLELQNAGLKHWPNGRRARKKRKTIASDYRNKPDQYVPPAELIGAGTRIMYSDASEYDWAGHLYGNIAKFGLGEIETTWMRKDGRSIHVLLRATALTGRDPSNGATIAILHITDRKLAESTLNDPLRQKGILLREIHHRVKNNLQIVSSLLALQSSVVQTQEAAAAMKSSQNRIHTMALIHEKLYRSTDLDHIHASDHVQKLAANLGEVCKQENRLIDFDIHADDTNLDVNVAVPCGLIITALVTNAMNYAHIECRTGKISVSLMHKDDRVMLSVADDGIELPEDSKIKKADTLGLKLADMFVLQLKGEAKINRGQGTSFTITFPYKSKNGLTLNQSVRNKKAGSQPAFALPYHNTS